MNAVINMNAAPVRSVVEERAMRAPVIGRIRPGIKVLTAKARDLPGAVKLYDELCAAGESFDAIATALESRFRLKGALVPKNVPYFTCRRSDFTNPDVADEILRRYGEDRGDGLRLYRFPVMFAFNDWMANLPNQMAAWGTSGRKYFSEYGPDGTRYCKTYEKVERDPRAQRATRTFGGRTIILRRDDLIPDGVCDPGHCPEYQSRQCNLTASFIFAIPEIRGLGLIELPTNSIYVLQKAYSAMHTVTLAHGRLTGTRFWLSKRPFDITRINDAGDAVRQSQQLTVLDADIDIAALLDGADDPLPALAMANDAVALLEESATVVSLHGDAPKNTSLDAGLPENEADQVHEVKPGPASGLAHSGTSAHATQVAEDDPAITNAPTAAESLEDGLHRMSDLLQRLGLSAEDRKQSFRIYAHARYGRGWTDRAQDVGQMNARLETALTDRGALDHEIAQAAHAALFA
ncbi:recombination directionality factor [Paraburkholderia megapolitana]|uniref:recombination directionality factor n=1 Tax=Paraburkholderia megapolitana TaxID=420953 RepID=UPI0038B6C4EB